MEEPVPAAVMQQFQTMRSTYNQLASKLQELDAEKSEHDVVIRAMTPLEKERKCFRLIGGVMVERTVGEVLPAVASNRDNLQQVIERMAKRIEELEAEMNAFARKYGLIKTDASAQKADNQASASSGDQKSAGGVLV